MLFVVVLEHGWYALGTAGSVFRVVPFGRKQSAFVREARKKKKRREKIVLDISEGVRGDDEK
jgi:hypothetical protein